MLSFGIWRHVTLVSTDVSEQLIVSSAVTRVARHHILEGGNLHCYRCENVTKIILTYQINSVVIRCKTYMQPHISVVYPCKYSVFWSLIWVHTSRHLQRICNLLKCKLHIKSTPVNLRKTLCFHGGDYEEWNLLGFYAVWLLYEPTFRRNLAPPSSEWQESVN
jgi:hypothetical protein